MPQVIKRKQVNKLFKESFSYYQKRKIQKLIPCVQNFFKYNNQNFKILLFYICFTQSKTFIHKIKTLKQNKYNKMISLGYWPIRGIAQVSRYLFEYLDVEYKDVKYSDPEMWFKKDKNSLGLDFPNLPYLIDNEDNVKLTESDAIKHYICAKWKPELLGSTLQEKGRVQMIYNVAKSIQEDLAVRLFDKANYHSMKDEAFKKVEPNLQTLEKAYEGRKFVLGDKISLADFQLYEALQVVYIVEPKVKAHFQNLAEFRQRFDKIPQIEQYKKSDRWIPSMFVSANVAANNV